MAVRPFSSTATRLEIGEGHIPYPVFADRTPATVPRQPAYLDLTTAEPVDAAWFMVALVPRRSIQAARAASERFETLTAAGWTGLSSIREDGARDLVAFSTAEGSRTTALNGWRTDAEAWRATTAGSEVRRVGAQQVRALQHEARVLLASDREVSVAIEYLPTGLTAAVQAHEASRVRLHLGRAPARTVMNGAIVTSSYDAATGMLSLSVPSGTTTIAISWTNDR